jgi:glucosamine--fructose-6-phosphate aminotransferase (isomerizing)
MTNPEPKRSVDLKDQAQMLYDLIEKLEPQVEQVITPDLARRIQKIYLTGCGDSFFAALAVRLFFDKYAAVPTEPIESMEFARYAVEAMPRDLLVVGISNSGRVSRTVEAVIQARRRGATTIAATGYMDRALAQEADGMLIGSLPNIRAVLGALDATIERRGLSGEGFLERIAEPGAAQRMAEALGIGSGVNLLMVGLGAYLSSILILYLIGLRLAELRGRLNAQQAADLKREMVGFTNVLVRTANADLQPSVELASALKNHTAFLFLGSGPSYASALLSAAKLFEQPHLNGVGQYLEEWAHLQSFFTRPDGPPIFVIVPPGNSRDRAMEVIRGAKNMGGRIIAVCDSEDSEVIELADWVMPIHGRLKEEFSPLVYVVPGQLFAFAMLQVRGQTPLTPPYTFQHLMEVNYGLIYSSAVWGA